MTKTADETRVVRVLGKGYSYQFSRGLLAHTLAQRGLPLDEAYSVAKKVHKVLVSEGVKEIKEKNLREYVKDQAIKIAGKEIAYQYNLIEYWHNSPIPLIILLSGAKGTGTSQMGKMLAEKLSVSQIVSTSIVGQILRGMIAKDLAPELHSKSYLAYKSLRPIYSVLYDKVLIGFEEHSRFIAEAVEAIVKRALNEGLSMIIRGEHLVPRFLSSEIIDHPNIIYINLKIKKRNIHEERYLSNYHKNERRERKQYFEAIRKIHDYLVEEAKNRNYAVIENSDELKSLTKIYDRVLYSLSEIFPNIAENIVFKPFDESIIHS